jgi:hypothetical protein
MNKSPFVEQHAVEKTAAILIEPNRLRDGL